MNRPAHNKLTRAIASGAVTMGDPAIGGSKVPGPSIAAGVAGHGRCALTAPC